jgi:hypothetical protein
MTTGAGAATPQPLDEMMLAMDVVDTLRRRHRLVEHELDDAGRELDLKARLRKIYDAQGIDVPDHILEEGVAALREDRFVYKPPPGGIRVWLARLYVNRARWGKWVVGGLGALLIAWGAYYMTAVRPRAALPDELQAMHQSVTGAAQSERARQAANDQLAAAQAALRDGNQDQARQALERLRALRTSLEQTYELRIVSRPGERTGVWRIPDANTNARNYYIIVEAVGPDGSILEVPVTSEETGLTEQVDKWALRVDERVFNRVAADKQDDGIIQERSFGVKQRGQLEPEYRVPTTGAAITQW